MEDESLVGVIIPAFLEYADDASWVHPSSVSIHHVVTDSFERGINWISLL